MTLTTDGSASNFGTSVSSVTTGTLTTTLTNDVIIVLVHNETPSGGTLRTVTSITDSVGLTWTLRKQYSIGTPTMDMNSDMEVWWAPAASTFSGTITANFSGAVDDCSIIAFAVNGVANTAYPWDPDASLPACNFSRPQAAVSSGPAGTTKKNTMPIAFGSSGHSLSQPSATRGNIAGVGGNLIAATGTNLGSNSSHVAAEQILVSTRLLNVISTFTTSPNWTNWQMIVDAVTADGPSTKTVFIQQGTTTWTVPSDWNSASNSFDAIGAGGGGASDSTSQAGTSGGGGEWRRLTNQTYTPGNVITVQVGAGGAGGAQATAGNDGSAGTSTFIKNDANSSTVLQANPGGGGIKNAGTAGAGGTGGTGGTGNNGGSGNRLVGAWSGCGGGGAGGPNGVGALGGNQASAVQLNAAGGGGGADGGGAGGIASGSTTNGAAGGASGTDGTAGGAGGLGGAPAQAGTAGSHGSGGGGGGLTTLNTTNKGGDGGAGIGFVQTSDGAVAGPGGGAGGGGDGGGGGIHGGDGGAGGLYGGGGGSSGDSNVGGERTGGAGANGILIITYSPASSPSILPQSWM